MSEYNHGDKVKLTKDGQTLDAQVNAFGGFATGLGTFTISPGFVADQGWTIEVIKPAVVLPTEDGFYLDSEGDVWSRVNGHLIYSSDSLTESDTENYAPFTRLYTLEEAGKEFWEQIMNTKPDWWAYDPWGEFNQAEIREVLTGGV